MALVSLEAQPVFQAPTAPRSTTVRIVERFGRFEGRADRNLDYFQCLPGTGSGTSAPAATSAAPAPTTFKTSKTAGSPTTATSTTGSSATATTSPGDDSNPLKGKNFYANSYYASEINNLAAPALVAAGNAALAAKASNVAKVGTFYWL